MSNNQTTKPAIAAASSAKAETSKPDLVTLEQLASEMKIPARDARMLLRLAANQKGQYPNLSKEHAPRQPWQWAPGSKALDEARKALSNPVVE